jgi:hypothetical protein
MEKDRRGCNTTELRRIESGLSDLSDWCTLINLELNDIANVTFAVLLMSGSQLGKIRSIDLLRLSKNHDAHEKDSDPRERRYDSPTGRGRLKLDLQWYFPRHCFSNPLRHCQYSATKKFNSRRLGFLNKSLFLLQFYSLWEGRAPLSPLLCTHRLNRHPDVSLRIPIRSRQLSAGPIIMVFKP